MKGDKAEGWTRHPGWMWGPGGQTGWLDLGDGSGAWIRSRAWRWQKEWGVPRAVDGRWEYAVIPAGDVYYEPCIFVCDSIDEAIAGAQVGLGWKGER